MSKRRENPLADGPKELGVVRANNGIWVVWRESIWGIDGGVTFDGHTMIASVDTARMVARDLLPPSGVDHYFQGIRERRAKIGPVTGMINTCECGCGLVLVRIGPVNRFYKDLDSVGQEIVFL